MKQFKKIILLLMVILPLNIKAASAVEDVNYKVTDVYVNATIDILGSMHVQEAIIVKGSLNGFERVINYKNPKLKEWEEGKIDFSNSSFYNGRGISFSKAYSYKIKKEDISFNVLDMEKTLFGKTDSAKAGDKNVYTVEEEENGSKVKIYNPNESGYMVYLFDYYVNQAVVLHNDVAELYWTFLPQDFDDVENVNIQLLIPGTSTDETFRFWAHGSLNGEVRGISDKKDDEGKYLYKGVLATVTDVKSGSGVDIRMTFDKDLMSVVEQILNHSKQDALEEIIKVETARAENANSQRLSIKIIFYTFLVITIIYILGLIIFWVYLYSKHDKEYKSKFKAKYYREFIEDYDVELVEYVMKKDITTNAFCASIMNMIYKKNIILEENPEDKKNYILKLKSTSKLNESEKIIIDLLFNKIGKNKKLKLKEIKKYSSDFDTCEDFMNAYNEWKETVVDTAKKMNFFEKNTKYKVAAGFYAALGFVILAFSAVMNMDDLKLIIPIITFTLAFIIYICVFKKWTNKGREDYLRWKAFKNFLNDFGTFDKKELPEITLWEKYLVFATVLGVAEKVEESMKIKLTHMTEEEKIGLPRNFTYGDYHFNRILTKNLQESYQKGHAKVLEKYSSNSKNAGSSMSSGSGFGGGFSSGGGFAGGGGSGRGF